MVETNIPKQEKLRNYQECANNVRQFILTGEKLPFAGEIIGTLQDCYLLIAALYNDSLIEEYIDKEFNKIPSRYEFGSKEWINEMPVRWSTAIANTVAAVGCLVDMKVLSAALAKVSKYLADSGLESPKDAAITLEALGEQASKEAEAHRESIEKQQEVPFKESQPSKTRFKQLQQEKYKKELSKLSLSDLLNILADSEKRVKSGKATQDDLENKQIVEDILREKQLSEQGSLKLSPQLLEDDYDYQYLSDNDKQLIREDVADYSNKEIIENLKDMVDGLSEIKGTPQWPPAYETLQYAIYLAKLKNLKIPKYILEY